MYYSELMELWKRSKSKPKGKPMHSQWVRMRFLPGDNKFEHFYTNWAPDSKEKRVEHVYAYTYPNNETVFVGSNMARERHAFNKMFDIQTTNNAQKMQHITDSTCIIWNTFAPDKKYVYRPGMVLNAENEIIYMPPYKKHVPDKEYNNKYTQMSKRMRRKANALIKLLPDYFTIETEIEVKPFTGSKYRFVTPTVKFKSEPCNPKAQLWKAMENEDLLTKEQLIIFAGLEDKLRNQKPTIELGYLYSHDKKAFHKEVLSEKLHKVVNLLRFEWLMKLDKYPLKTFDQPVI